MSKISNHAIDTFSARCDWCDRAFTVTQLGDDSFGNLICGECNEDIFGEKQADAEGEKL